MTIFKQFFYRFFSKKQKLSKVKIIPQTEHTILQKDISHNALKVLRRLHQHNYSAYLVGGCLRDLLLQHNPKDFDIATDAKPEKIKKLFRNCFLIGRRFRLAHICFGRDVIEVSTFRAHSKKMLKHREIAQHGMLLRDNVYGTIEEDVWRRDFTINALYYNPTDSSLIDYCGGITDIKNKVVRIIGNPRLRYQEDPVRLLRAIRFAGKLGFHLDPATAEPIQELAPLLRYIPPARLFEETLKLFHHGNSLKTYQLLRQYHLFEELFPPVDNLSHPQQLLELACVNTDQRILEGKTVSPAFLFAVFLWPVVQNKAKELLDYLPRSLSYQQAASYALSRQQNRITIPRRYSSIVREIWDLQHKLTHPRPILINRLIQHPRFRSAYDFLLLRAQINEVPSNLAYYWKNFSKADEVERKKLMEEFFSHFSKETKKHIRNKGKLQ